MKTRRPFIAQRKPIFIGCEGESEQGYAGFLQDLIGRTAHRPPTNQATQNAIRQEWPQYQKPMSRAELARKIDREAVIRAAGVEDHLMVLLRCIGLTPPKG